MRVGDLVGYINGDGPMGLVLARWQEWQPGGDDYESWVRVLWDDGVLRPQLETRLEKINESR